MPIGTTVTSNLAVRQAIATSMLGYVPVNILTAGGGTGATAQAGATPLRSGVNSVGVSPVSGASCILPSITTNETSAQLTIVINDAPTNSIAVFAAVGESMNVTPNGALTIAPGGFGIFVMRPQDPAVGGTPPSWRGAAFT